VDLSSVGELISSLVLGVSTLFGGQPSATPLPLSPISLERHQTFHYPEPEDLPEATTPTPYLVLPFRSADLQSYEVSQGWIYSQKELEIHHANPIHAAVDFYVPYGTTVASPVDGYAMSSYETSWVREGGDYKERVKENNKESDKPVRLYQGKPIRLGLGNFIYIYVPSVNRFLELGHLSEIDPKIPFSPPEYNPKTDGWEATNYDTSIIDMPTSPDWVKVSRGDTLGKVGYSGLTWGYDDYIKDSQRPLVIDPKISKSWDIPHVHFEEFYINQETKQKGWQRDPYGIYDTYEYYPTPKRAGQMGKDPLWLLDQNNLPQFAQ
jgi:hypothetical protein